MTVTLLVSDVRCTAPHDVSEASSCAYRVAWAINPHMNVGAVEPWRAVRQHDHFVHTLGRVGARVVRMPFVHGAYDSVFAKDNAVVVAREGGRIDALLASPLHVERQREQRARAEALAKLGVHVQAAPTASLEGGDVVMLPEGRGALLGYGYRSAREAAAALARFLDAPVVPIELRDARLYHLDTAVAVLGDGTALVCEEALTTASLRALERAPGVRAIVRVPLAEALRFGANVVEVNGHVVLGEGAPHVEAALRARGFTVHAVPLGEFHHAGGSAACLVAAVHARREAAVARSESAA